VTDRLKRMYGKIQTDHQHIGIEKFKIITRTESECAGYPPMLRRGQTLKNVLNEFPIFINEDELIVGNPASQPWGLEIEAGLGKWSKDECDYLREDGFDFSVEDQEEMLRINEQFHPFGMYQGANLIIAENERMDIFARSGMMLAPWKKDKKLGNRVGGGAACSGLGNGPGWMLLCIDFELALKKGVKAMIAECDEEFEKNRYFSKDSYKRGITLQAMKLCLEGMVDYAERFSKLAAEMAEKETRPERKAELKEISEICKRVPAYPAQTFREALQCFWFMFLLVNPSPTPAIGRFDQYMYPYYKADIEAGRITNEEVLELLGMLRIRCMEMNQQSGREIRKRASGSARWMNMTIGGVKPDGTDACNELTRLILQAVLDVRTPHHTVTLRVCDTTPDDVMLLALKCQAEGCSMPAFIGDESYIAYFTQKYGPDKGLPIEDARDYCMTGCIDGNVAGRTRTMGITMFVCPLMLDIFMNNGWDKNIDEQVGHKIVGDLSKYETFDQFLADFKPEYEYFMEQAAEKLNVESSTFKELLPDPFRAAFMRNGIQSGLDCYDQEYPFESNQLLNPVGMINLAQCLYAIKKLCFEKKVCTLPEMKKAMDANWEGYEDLRKQCLELEHYGNGDDECDDMVRTCYRWWVDYANTIPSSLGGHFRCSAISVTSHQPGGALCGAMPDGRKKGDILADACASPMAGTDHEGPLSIFQSALKIPQEEFQAMLLNIKFAPSALKSDADKMKLASAIKIYFANGGKHVQFIVADQKTLIDAKEHPEAHKDLMVRVAGYSAYFIQLTPGLQSEVIERTSNQKI
jgi:pyruvate-formate lyase